MQINYEHLLCEKWNCSLEVQKVIEKYKEADITIMLFRNICQIILENELKPSDIIDFYKKFAEIYSISETLQEIKDKLLLIIK
jgi:hypothetical protein